MCTRRKKNKKLSDQIVEPWTWLVSPLQVHLSPSILWYEEPQRGWDISNRHPPLPASTENRSLILPPAKSPSAPPAQQNNKKLHNPMHSQANLDCNILWQFVFDTGISAWCFAVIFSGYNCLQNKCIQWRSKIFFCLSKLHSAPVLYCILTSQAAGLQCISKRWCSTQSWRGKRVSVGFGTVLVIHVCLP